MLDDSINLFELNVFLMFLSFLRVMLDMIEMKRRDSMLTVAHYKELRLNIRGYTRF
jgi:hypothetical protein